VEKDSVLLHKVQESLFYVAAKKQKGTEFSFCTHKEKFLCSIKGRGKQNWYFSVALCTYSFL
jgi:hypothetical protein